MKPYIRSAKCVFAQMGTSDALCGDGLPAAGSDFELSFLSTLFRVTYNPQIGMLVQHELELENALLSEASISCRHMESEIKRKIQL